ncbi:uncharacterized protein LOC115794000 [Archocentrus centrarchus]|uniref:uncharacterized protein LOC115794000 n=1 Tax=Archocentrus centrarchus TaxID=63155 RepID=UPI0011EA1CA0|nr:uncharacterized protein LOC115794000 [Archocentrus centrarchus]
MPSPQIKRKKTSTVPPKKTVRLVKKKAASTICVETGVGPVSTWKQQYVHELSSLRKRLGAIEAQLEHSNGPAPAPPVECEGCATLRATLDSVMERLTALETHPPESIRRQLFSNAGSPVQREEALSTPQSIGDRRRTLSVPSPPSSVNTTPAREDEPTIPSSTNTGSITPARWLYLPIASPPSQERTPVPPREGPGSIPPLVPTPPTPATQLPSGRALTAERDEEFYKDCFLRGEYRPENYAANVFMAITPFETYQSWAKRVNWSGTNGKDELPRQVKEKVVCCVQQRFPDLSGQQWHNIRRRINERLRSPRKLDPARQRLGFL